MPPKQLKHKAHPLLLVKRSGESSKHLDIPESRPETCDHCHKNFKNVQKHWAKNQRCFELERAAFNSRAANHWRRTKLHRSSPSPREHTPSPTRDDHSNITIHDYVDHDGDIELLDGDILATENVLDPRLVANDYIEGPTEFYDGNIDSDTESRSESPSFEEPLEDIIRPAGQNAPHHNESTIPTPILRPDNDGFHPGCVRHFPPHRRAGAPVPESPDRPPEKYETPYDTWHREWKDRHPNITPDWAPFSSAIDWYLAQWLMESRIGKGQIDRLLQISGVRYPIATNHFGLTSISKMQFKDQLHLSYGNARELYSLIDSIPSRGKFRKTTLLLPGYEEVGPIEVWHRPLKEVVQSILAQPDLAPHMLWAPEMRYSGDTFDEQYRQFGEVNTTDHWWEEQANSPDGSTICPLIISMDETCLTDFGGDQVVYPVTVAPAIVPGPIRARMSSMARQLVGYIPTDDPVGIIGPKEDTSHWNLAVHHASLKMMFSPAREAMKGPGWPTVCGDGFLRLIIPTFPSFLTDFPEQGTFTACRGCGTCDIPDNEMGMQKIGNIRDPAETLNHLHIAGNILGVGDVEQYLKEHRLKYVFRPWWEGMTRCNPHLACMPDLLHQVWQGLIKHLTVWIIVIVGKVEVDARVRRLAPCHGSRHFKNGITGLAQISGREHRQIATFLLAIVQGVPGLSAPDQVDLSSATRALIDFAYLAEYRQHDEDTLAEMKNRLDMWDKHKEVFIRLTWRDNLDLPKLHGFQHYIDSIRRVGSLKYLSTDESEKAHIYVAKRPFESSNKREPKGQMVTIYDRWDKVRLHANWMQHLRWVECCEHCMKTPLYKFPI